MKSKHRYGLSNGKKRVRGPHELKTNDLAEWLSNLPRWTKENFKMIIGISVVAILAIALVIGYWYSKNIESARKQFELTKLIAQLPLSKMQILRAQTQGRDYSFVLLETADSLRAAAQSAKDDPPPAGPRRAAFALIKRAEILRMELHYRLGTVDAADVEAAINRAKASYIEALSLFTPPKAPQARGTINPSLMAAAKFGLGLCEEEIGNFEKARQIYRETSANALFEGTTAAAQAKQRLDTIPDYQQKIVFKPAQARPEPVPPEFIQPQIKLETPDSNLRVLQN